MVDREIPLRIELFASLRVAARNVSRFSWNTMSRNGLYALIGMLMLIVVGLVGYMIYQQSQEPSLEIRLDSNGVQVTGNG
jgi:hypothetical protein